MKFYFGFSQLKFWLINHISEFIYWKYIIWLFLITFALRSFKWKYTLIEQNNNRDLYCNNNAKDFFMSIQYYSENFYATKQVFYLISFLHLLNFILKANLVPISFHFLRRWMITQVMLIWKVLSSISISSSQYFWYIELSKAFFYLLGLTILFLKPVNFVIIFLLIGFQYFSGLCCFF